jgi:hypothetical protein
LGPGPTTGPIEPVRAPTRAERRAQAARPGADAPAAGEVAGSAALEADPGDRAFGEELERPQTSGRGRRHPAAATREPSARGGRIITTFATVALCALIGLSAFASPLVVAAAVALGGLVVAWGWPTLLGSPSRIGSTLVLALATVACVGAVALTTTDPYLRYLPAAIAGALLFAFLHQILRRDGRPRLSESVAITASGIAVIASGAALVPLPLTYRGVQPLTVAMAAMGAAALVDLRGGRQSKRAWLLPMAMLLGGGAGVGAAYLLEGPALAPALLIGVVVAAVSHALRRVLAVLPPIAGARGRLVSAASSVLACGMVTYVLSRAFIA